jgi:hypothetical protein
MAATERKVIVVLVKEKKPYAFVAQAKGIVAAMTGNDEFPDPDPTLESITALIAAYEQTLPKGAATVETRREKRWKLEQGLEHLRDYVQARCEKEPIETAAAIAASANMRLKKRRTQAPKPPIAVTWGEVSGAVVVTVPSLGRNVLYYYQHSLDGETWSERQLFAAQITITGLTPGQNYQFRFRAFKKGAYTDFSQIVTLLVR